MEDEALVVLITVPSRETGTKIAQTLLERRLAACVNLLPQIQSMYWWEGKIQTDEEVILVVKTRRELFESDLMPAVRQIHPYDLPEIIALPVAQGLPEYLAWIMESTTPESSGRE